MSTAARGFWLGMVVLLLSLGVSSSAGASATRTSGPDSVSVYRLYWAYFLREPDVDGLTYWNRLHLDGVPLSAISQEFTRSREFQRRYGALDNAGFVRLVYRNVLEREPDPRGLAHWTAVLDGGRASRGGVMLGFSDSAEFKGKIDSLDQRSSLPRGSFSFIREVDGVPVGWDPCSPIDVVVNYRDAPPFAREHLPGALARMADATGVEWRLIGETSEWHPSSASRPMTDPARYGNRWSPVLIQWDLSIPYAGMAGPRSVRHQGGGEVFVTGTTWLGRTTHESTFAYVGTLIHELGHVFGLEHTAFRGNVMGDPGASWTAAGWGPGDLEGFRTLRRGGCVAVPAP